MILVNYLLHSSSSSPPPPVLLSPPLLPLSLWTSPLLSSPSAFSLSLSFALASWHCMLYFFLYFILPTLVLYFLKLSGFPSPKGPGAAERESGASSLPGAAKVKKRLGRHKYHPGLDILEAVALVGQDAFQFQFQWIVHADVITERCAKSTSYNNRHSMIQWFRGQGGKQGGKPEAEARKEGVQLIQVGGGGKKSSNANSNSTDVLMSHVIFIHIHIHIQLKPSFAFAL
eukprot:scaffold175486_cov26-Tisochrysis_lutea.AAC.1